MAAPVVRFEYYGDDWIEIYVNDKMITRGHSLSSGECRTILEALFIKTETKYYQICDVGCVIKEMEDGDSSVISPCPECGDSG